VRAGILATTVALARLLTPGEFGVGGLALVFSAYVGVATDLGVAQALIFMPPERRRNDAALVVITHDPAVAARSEVRYRLDAGRLHAATGVAA